MKKYILILFVFCFRLEIASFENTFLLSSNNFKNNFFLKNAFLTAGALGLGSFLFLKYKEQQKKLAKQKIKDLTVNFYVKPAKYLLDTLAAKEVMEEVKKNRIKKQQEDLADQKKRLDAEKKLNDLIIFQKQKDLEEKQRLQALKIAEDLAEKNKLLEDQKIDIEKQRKKLYEENELIKIEAEIKKRQLKEYKDKKILEQKKLAAKLREEQIKNIKELGKSIIKPVKFAGGKGVSLLKKIYSFVQQKGKKYIEDRGIKKQKEVEILKEYDEKSENTAYILDELAPLVKNLVKRNSNEDFSSVYSIDENESKELKNLAKGIDILRVSFLKSDISTESDPDDALSLLNLCENIKKYDAFLTNIKNRSNNFKSLFSRENINYDDYSKKMRECINAIRENKDKALQVLKKIEKKIIDYEKNYIEKKEKFEGYKRKNNEKRERIFFIPKSPNSVKEKLDDEILRLKESLSIEKDLNDIISYFVTYISDYDDPTIVPDHYIELIKLLKDSMKECLKEHNFMKSFENKNSIAYKIAEFSFEVKITKFLLYEYQFDYYIYEQREKFKKAFKKDPEYKDKFI